MTKNNAKLVASATGLAALVALGACMSSSGTGTMGGPATAGATPSATVGEPTPVAPTNTGQPAQPGPVDTTAATRTRPTGAANSTNGTGNAVASIGGGLAGQPSGASAEPGNLLTNIGSDARIVSAIDVLNTDEIAAGMLARDRARSPQVRAYAQHMITDHTRLQGADRALASQSQFISSDSADVTREMRRRDEASMVRLRAMAAGPGFDAAYIASEVDDHKHALELLNASKTQARDARVRDLATSAIPVIQDHLDRGMAIQRSMGSM